MKATFSLVAVLLFVGGCSDGAEGTDAGVGYAQQAIGWGKLVPATVGAPDTSAVKLEISQAGGGRLCTGIKVDANTFWTAASCIQRAVVGDQVRVTNNVEGNFSGSSSYTVGVASVDVHPSWKNYFTNGQTGPRHYDVGRFVLAASTPNIPSYSTTHSGWMGPGQTVTYTAYGNDPESPNSGKKQYGFFALVDSTAFADATPHDQMAADAIYVRHMLSNPLMKSYSARHDEGAAVFQKFSGTWKIVGLLPAETRDTTFVRYGNVRNWLAAPAVNQFQDGFRGFIFNRSTGACIQADSVDLLSPADCDGRDQDSDRQSWKLVAWGSEVGFFQLVNGSNGRCLEAVPDFSSFRLKYSACVVPGVGAIGQRWNFANTSHPDYREIRNGLAPGCMTVQFGPLEMRACTGASFESWVMTR